MLSPTYALPEKWTTASIWFRRSSASISSCLATSMRTNWNGWPFSAAIACSLRMVSMEPRDKSSTAVTL